MPEDPYQILKDALPSTTPMKGFEGTVFGFPLLYGITGKKEPDLDMIEQALGQLKDREGGYHLNALWLAELAESAMGDADLFFIGDDRFRSMCVGLNQGTNGWALIIGEADRELLIQLAEGLSERRLRLFASGPAAEVFKTMEEDVASLSDRDTGLVYFGQMLVRYALIYGMAPPGEAHEISHLIEEKAPGVIFAAGDPSGIEKLLVQGLLALGAPVITVNGDHGLVGPVIVAETVPEMVEAAWRLPNIRARTVERATSDVPVPVGPVFSREKLGEDDTDVEMGGSGSSFIVVMPSPDVAEDEVRVIGPTEDPSGFSVLVELGNEAADPPVTLQVESVLRRVINYAKGVKVRSEGQGNVRFVMTREAKDAGFNLGHLGDIVTRELRIQFSAIGPVRVTFILDQGEEEKRYPGISAFVEERTRQVRARALAHACTVSPGRPAQCSKPWYYLKAYAVLSPGDVYNPCQIIEKGECLDPVRGEYEGVNRSTHERTEGRVGRVFLHSIFDHPHTSCSCFQNVAYHIPEVDGIAIMNRGFKGEAPNGMTWTKLANMVAGKQYRGGAAAIATAYLLSEKFLQGDGGYRRVVWMTETLKKTAYHAIPEGLRDSIATEKEARTLEELVDFLKAKGRAPAPP